MITLAFTIIMIGYLCHLGSVDAERYKDQETIEILYEYKEEPLDSIYLSDFV